jgi:hypothetical protein
MGESGNSLLTEAFYNINSVSFPQNTTSITVLAIVSSLDSRITIRRNVEL